MICPSSNSKEELEGALGWGAGLGVMAAAAPDLSLLLLCEQDSRLLGNGVEGSSSGGSYSITWWVEWRLLLEMPYGLPNPALQLAWCTGRGAEEPAKIRVGG